MNQGSVWIEGWIGNRWVEPDDSGREFCGPCIKDLLICCIFHVGKSEDVGGSGSHGEGLQINQCSVEVVGMGG